MRIAQQENSVEKRGWVAWFTRKTNKTSRHRPQASFCSPEGEETLRPPWSDLRSPGKISKLGGPLCSRWKLSQRLRERMTWGDQYFEELIPILYFPGSVFIHWDVMQKSRRDSSPDFYYKSQVLRTNVYRGLRGVTSSSGQGGLLTISDPLLVTAVSQPEHLFLQEWLFLKQTPTK